MIDMSWDLLVEAPRTTHPPPNRIGFEDFGRIPQLLDRKVGYGDSRGLPVLAELRDPQETPLQAARTTLCGPSGDLTEADELFRSRR